MVYKRPTRDENAPFICGFRTTERISGHFSPEDNIVVVLNQLLHEAREKYGMMLSNTDWVGFKGDEYEHFFIMEKIENYASMMVKDYSSTSDIELICCVP